MAPRVSLSPKVQESAQVTAARIKKIHDHFHHAPRSGRLAGKVGIITGVGSLKGIGRAAALAYAREGAKHLYLLDLDGTNLPELKKTIEEKFPDVAVDVQACDAADEDAIRRVCQRALDDEGQLDVFFANAGIATQAHLSDTSAEQFQKTMRINTLSCFLALKYASEAMQKTNAAGGKTESGGSIIMTASVAGIRSGAGPLDYSASKSAVNNMAQTAPYQLSRTGVRVNSICPGLIETGMTTLTFDLARERGVIGKVGQLNPLGRFGIAEEIANVALFLASDDSSYVNGQNIAVDGGLSASHPTGGPGRWS
ncbi:NAD(P)-binding protein [Flagelloscypha sp. PMI_526]|nr:NAD(P)-binding protein [Flagelloscypha sp. PMI_526]